MLSLAAIAEELPSGRGRGGLCGRGGGWKPTAKLGEDGLWPPTAKLGDSRLTGFAKLRLGPSGSVANSPVLDMGFSIKGKRPPSIRSDGNLVNSREALENAAQGDAAPGEPGARPKVDAGGMTGAWIPRFEGFMSRGARPPLGAA